MNEKFAAEHPDTVRPLLRGHVKSVDWLNGAAAGEKASVINAALKEAAGAELKDGVEAGTTKQADISGIFDLTALNEVTGQETSAARLGKE